MEEVETLKSEEQETRERLLAEAARLFAAHGFGRVTVRDICRAAHANVAAINYHFRGKKGLYDAVVQLAIDRMQATTQAIVAAGAGQPPEQQVTAYVTIFLQRVTGTRDNWIHQLMMRELTEPTPALDLVVREVLEPRIRYLAGVVASLLRCRADDPRVQRSVMSVHMQCLAAIDTRMPVHRVPAAPAAVAELADHISKFSLGGIAALSASPRSRVASRGIRLAPPERPRRRPLRP